MRTANASLRELMWRLQAESRRLTSSRFFPAFLCCFYLAFTCFCLQGYEVLSKPQFILSEYVAIFPWLLVIFVPILVAWGWPSRPHDPFLASGLPVWLLLLPRFLVHWLFLGLTLAVSLVTLLNLLALGRLDLGPLATSFAAYWLLSGCLLALGVLLQYQRPNRQRSFLASVLACSLLIACSPNYLDHLFPGRLPPDGPFATFAPMVHLHWLTLGFMRWHSYVYLGLLLMTNFLLLAWSVSRLKATVGWR